MEPITNTVRKIRECIICGNYYEGNGNNAYPLANGKCCDNCNMDVIDARILKVNNELNGILESFRVVRKWGEQSYGVVINKIDAVDKGIKEGDWVKVTIEKVHNSIKSQEDNKK